MRWTLSGHVAELAWAPWKWCFDLAKPSAGVAVQGADREPWHLMQVEPVPGHSFMIDDSFTRGSDLMVRYGQSPADRFAFQLDYRAVTLEDGGPEICGFDIWLSVQTQLLDSHPILELTNRLPGGAWQALDAQGGLLMDGDPPIAMLTCQVPHGSAALLIHPSDQVQCELLATGEKSRLRMFGNFMEKGVIRRGRVRCLVSESVLSASVLQSLYEQFASSPLPLTT